MYLSKSKCWYSNSCLHFFKVSCSIHHISSANDKTMEQPSLGDTATILIKTLLIKTLLMPLTDAPLHLCFYLLSLAKLIYKLNELQVK
jgi:hypothetical protein